MHQNTQEPSRGRTKPGHPTVRSVGQVRSATHRKHTAEEKTQVLEKVEASPGSKGTILAKLGVSKSDCCRWRVRAKQGSLEDRRHPGPSWNRLSPQEESVVLDVAIEHTELSSRQLVAWITGQQRLFSLRVWSVSTLKRQRLVKSPEMKMAG